MVVCFLSFYAYWLRLTQRELNLWRDTTLADAKIIRISPSFGATNITQEALNGWFFRLLP